MMQYAYVTLLIAAVLYALYRVAGWAERDALLRGKSPFFVKCAVILFFPWGLVAWLLFRPDPVNPLDLASGGFDLNSFREN